MTDKKIYMVLATFHREDYLRKVGEAAQSLVDDGYMLAEDLDAVLERAELRFDFFARDAKGG